MSVEAALMQHEFELDADYRRGAQIQSERRAIESDLRWLMNQSNDDVGATRKMALILGNAVDEERVDLVNEIARLLTVPNIDGEVRHNIMEAMIDTEMANK